MPLTPTVGNEVTFSSDPLAALPRVTALADDTFVLGWENGSDLFARHLSATGSFITGNFLSEVSATDAAPLTTPLLVQQNDGALMSFFGRLTTTENEDIHSHPVHADFSPDSNERPIEVSGTNETLADATAQAGGGSVVAYSAPGTGGAAGQTRTVLRFVDTAGDPTGNHIFVGAGATGSQDDVAIASLPNDNIVVAYDNIDPATSVQDVRFDIVSPQGFDSGGFTISTPGSRASFPDVAVLPDGSFVVVWQQNGGLAIQHVLESGQFDGPAARISDADPNADGGSFLPKITALKDGTFLVAWTHASGTESDGSPNEDIFVRRFGLVPNGGGPGVNIIGSFGSLTHLAEPGDQGLFQTNLATLSDGRVLLAYASETGDATNVTTLDYRIIDPRDPVMTGTEQADTIVGREDSSTISGLGGDDKLTGLGGDDILDGGLGNDILNGGAGSDTAAFSSVAAAVNVDLSVGTASGQGSDTLIGIENVVGSAAADTIKGDAGANVIDGQGGADIMEGLGGNDTYFVDSRTDVVREVAGGGDDKVLTSISYNLQPDVSVETLAMVDPTGTTTVTLTGNNLAQTIVGNDGRNIIAGGAGNDTLTGRGGPDTFLFDRALDAATNVDRITDFNVTDDTIRLNHVVFTALAQVGTLSPADFFVGTAAHDADDRIIYNQATGSLVYDSNGNAAGGATPFATVTPGLLLTANDFQIV